MNFLMSQKIKATTTITIIIPNQTPTSKTSPTNSQEEKVNASATKKTIR